MRRPLTLLGIATLLFACTSAGRPDPGQSGSEFGGPPIDVPARVPPGVPPRAHCPCSSLRDMQQLRATVTKIEEFPEVGDYRYSLQVDAVLSAEPDSAEPLAVGDMFGGYWNGVLPCSGMSQPSAADQVLAFYRRGLQDGAVCCERIACSDACRRQLPEGQTDQSEACESTCEQQTETACAQHAQEARMRGTVVLLPWGNEFSVGSNEFGTASISIDDLPALTGDQASCEAAISDRFGATRAPDPQPAAQPAQPPPPANGAPQPAALPPPAAVPAPQPTPPPPTTPVTPPGAGAMAPAMSLTPVPNSTTVVNAPPAAHPEEVRVRCAH